MAIKTHDYSNKLARLPEVLKKVSSHDSHWRDHGGGWLDPDEEWEELRELELNNPGKDRSGMLVVKLGPL